MAATSAGQQQLPQQQQQQQQKVQQQQFVQLQTHGPLHLQSYQQHQQQQHQTKFVPRVVTNATTTKPITATTTIHQQQTQHLPAGLVNGNSVITTTTTTVQPKTTHVFLTPPQQQQQQQHQQQQQLQVQRPTQIKLPLKTTAAVAQCMPPTIAMRQMSQNNLNVRHVAKQALSGVDGAATVLPDTGTSNCHANLAPGWRRLTSNNEVAYISPTGATLRTHYQIKDYLLSQGTCKCGLPCPLRPDYFFDFNAQVPNMLLSVERSCKPNDDATSASKGHEADSALCLHRQRFLESQQLHAMPMSATGIASTHAVVMDVFAASSSSPASAASSSSSATSSDAMSKDTVECRKFAIRKATATMQTSNNNNNNNGSNQQKQTFATNTNTNVNVNASSQVHKMQPQQQQQQQHMLPNVIRTTNASVEMKLLPPPPSSSSSSMITSTTVTATTTTMPQTNSSHASAAAHDASNRSESDWQRISGQQPQQQQQQQQQMKKQQPNFKDDPTGYLQQQTALLHNSMLNVTMQDGVVLPSHDAKQKADESIAVAIAVTVPEDKETTTMTNVQQRLDGDRARQLVAEAAASTQPSQQQMQRRMSLYPAGGGKWDFEQIARFDSESTLVNMDALQRPSLKSHSQKAQITSIRVVPAPQQSPVSSSTTFAARLVQPEAKRNNADVIMRRPEQVGAISTSYESPRHCLSASPSEMLETAQVTTVKALPVSSPAPSPSPSHVQAAQAATVTHAKPQVLQMRVHPPLSQHQHVQQVRVVRQQQQPQGQVRTPTAATTTVVPALTRNSVTSLAGMRAASATTTTSPSVQAQAQTVLRANEAATNGQIIMTSTGQLLVIPGNGKTHIQHQQQPQQHHQQQQQQQRQHLIVNSNGSPTTATVAGQPTSVIIQQQATPTELTQIAANSGAGIILQNGQTAQNHSYIVSSQPTTSSSNNNAATPLQSTTVILNSGQNILTTNNAKLLTANSSNILHAGSQQILSGNQLIAAQGQPAATIGQQTVVLNTLPNGGYIVQQQQPQQQQQQHQHHPHHQQQQQQNTPATQQQFASLDGQIMQLQQQQQQQTQQIILHSPDGKRRGKKRKPSLSNISPNSSPSKSISPQISPSIPNQTPTAAAAALLHQQHHHQQHQQQQQHHQQQHQSQLVQIAAPATATQFPQQFQLSPGIQGIVVNKTATTAAPQPQQLLLQNGQIIQPVNLIGQQLIMPTGLMMAPDTTLLQIQNVGTCAQTSILTPQGPMMLRTPSPQNKPFISPTTPSQQFIVGANGQLSPIGQIYSTHMGLVLPAGQQTSATTTTFMQASPSIQLQQQQQQQQQQHSTQQHNISIQQATSGVLQTSSVASEHKPFNDQTSGQRAAAASPPDTTTCSPRSPDRPPSHRSTGSDMVQCVSSSEPDAAVSPQSADSRQSPSSTDCERGGNFVTNIFNSPAHIYKPPEAKMRRIQTSSQHGVSMSQATIAKAATSANTDSPTHSPTTTIGSQTPPPSTNAQRPSEPQEQQATADGRPTAVTPSKQQQQRTPNKRVRTRQRGWRNAVTVTSNGSNNNGTDACISEMPPRSFAIGELIWGPARGHPAWPGKIVKMPDGVCTPSQQFDHVWVQWFGGGGRSTSELIPVNSLQSLSEGLEAHHKAQKDTRKSRKLNSQLERAIQEAMIELDHISASSTSTSPAPTPTPALATSTSTNQANSNKQLQQPSSTSSCGSTSGTSRSKRNTASATAAGGGTVNVSAPCSLAATNTSVVLTSAGTLHTIFNAASSTQQQQQRVKPIRIAPAPAPSSVSVQRTPDKLNK